MPLKYDFEKNIEIEIDFKVSIIRDEIIDFSTGYINIAQRIMVATDSDISSLQDLLDYIDN